MKKPNHKLTRARLFLFALLLAALVVVSGPVQAVSLDFLAPPNAQALAAARLAAVHSELETLSDGEMTTVIVTLRNQADLTRVGGDSRDARLSQVIRILQNQANATQNHLQALLRTRQEEGMVAAFESYWVFNGLAVTATAEVIEELAARPEVALITPDDIDIQPTAQTSGAAPEANLSVVNAPALWDLGYRGQGIVVANMDTGVYKDHPDLATRWRGGANSWFDPYGEHPLVPVDYDGHGTWTMGVMVGGDAGGTLIGMAPDAQWVAVKIFDDSGQSTASGIHAAYQWLLDPDGDPGTADAPHVVNNSWSFSNAGCNLEFQLDLLSLRAAGILPVFAAGNAGPGSGTSRSPANNPGAFAVGATDNGDVIYYQSSRGPSSCDAGAVYPALVAPGVAIRTTDSSGYYYAPSGTSLAAPHVAGALALLLSASPDLTVGMQESSLLQSAVDLGSPGTDEDFGYGRLDVLAALQWLANNPAPTPTPSPAPADNLALGQAVTVSSKDGNHNGADAVDGDGATEWRTKPASGRRSLSEEWIEVDLGATALVDGVTLLWNANYATGYVLELSEDGSNWVSAFGTTAGDGGTDELTFTATSARYVRMVSTAWHDGSLRNWLAEFEIYGSNETPAPTSTPVPTDTPTPGPTATTAPTPTPTPTVSGQSTMHLGGLSGSSRRVGRDWRATVTALVHANGETPLVGATVTGAWSGGYAGPDSCVTDTSGSCSLTTPKIDRQQGSATFTVDQVSLALYTYLPGDNHDPAGDAVTVFGP